MEKMFVHDGLIFHYTTEAIASGDEILGFYFDALGHAQRIYRESLYGQHIIAREEEERKGRA